MLPWVQPWGRGASRLLLPALQLTSRLLLPALQLTSPSSEGCPWPAKGQRADLKADRVPPHGWKRRAGSGGLE